MNLLLTLQNGVLMTVGELGEPADVRNGQRRRDLDVLSGAGVPVFATRGCNGGFELLDTFEQDVPRLPPGLTPGRGRLRRVRVRTAPRALQQALVLDDLPGGAPRQQPSPTPTARRGSKGLFVSTPTTAPPPNSSSSEIDVEVLLPVELRDAMARIAVLVTALHDDGSAPAPWPAMIPSDPAGYRHRPWWTATT